MTTNERYLIWFLAGPLVAAAVAWIAFGLQREGFAPAVLFPLLAGGAVGIASAMVRRFTRVPGTRAAMAAAAAWGLLVVVAQDYIGHRHRLQVYDEQMARHGPAAAAASPEMAELRPRFGDYLVGVVRRNPAWWTLDIALTAAGAALVVALGAREDRTTPHSAA
jgi:hypothetical protein